jgi:adenylate kinase
MGPKIIIAGAPASGKGTQCEFIKEAFGCVHLSTGDMLRAAVVAGTDLGKEAKGHMDSGGLVPDKLIIDIIIARLAEPDCVKDGWLLDGFPRTRAQADALAEAGLACDTFILLNVPDHLLVERVCGRRSDPETGIIYHIKYKPPPNDEIANRLTQRSDDTEEAIMVRVKNFHSNVNAIIDAYLPQLLSVDGTRAPTLVWNEIQSRINRSFKREIIMSIGAPGSGRKNVCIELAKSNGYEYINCGEILRNAVINKNENFDSIQKSLDNGTFVDSNIVYNLVYEQFLLKPTCKRWLLDGYARNESLVNALNTTTASDGIENIIENVFYFDLSSEQCIESLNRRNETNINNRIDQYNKNNKPIKDYYQRNGKLRLIHNNIPIKAATSIANKYIRATSILPVYERTFAMIKPDAVSQGHIPAIMTMITEAKLNIIYSNLITMNDAVINEFYNEHLNKDFFPRLKQFMLSGPVLVMVLEGTNAIKVWRNLLGPTATQKAVVEAPDSIRAKFGTDGTQNAAHGSDSSASASREINFWTDPNSIGAKCVSGIIQDVVPVTEGEATADETAAPVEPVQPVEMPVPERMIPLQDTFAMIKPGTCDSSYQDITDIIVSHGFEIVQELKTKLSLIQAQIFYSEHEGKPFYEELCTYMSSGNIVALHLRRESAITSWRHLIGPTNYKVAQDTRPDSIRGKFAIDGTRNACHGSDSESSALRELKFFFSIGSIDPQLWVPLGQSSSAAFAPVSVPNDSTTGTGGITNSDGSPFKAPKRYSSKVRTVPTISNTDLTLMEAYANYDVEPIMKNLLQSLMIKRPEDVTTFALQELAKMHISSGKVMPSFDYDVGVAGAGTTDGNQLNPIVSPRSQPGSGAL